MTDEYAQPVLVAGRGLSCHVRLGDDTGIDRMASRQHAELRSDGSRLVLYDLGSRNGTLVNGRRITRAVLKDGDQVEFGQGGPKVQVGINVTEDDAIQFLRETRMFGKLLDDTLKHVVAAGTMATYLAESHLFRVGEPCEHLYVVQSGVVEVWRDTGGGRLEVVTYLGEGDMICEALVLLDRLPHQSAARVPESAVVLRLGREPYQRLIAAHPELALAVCTTLAGELSGTYRNERTRNLRSFQGNLNFYDLPTVVQTLMNSHETGVLSISALEVGFTRSGLWSSSDEVELPTAVAHFVDGKVTYAQCGHLGGEQAFFQMFQADHRGCFTFDDGPPPAMDRPANAIAGGGYNLLLEAVRLREAFRRLRVRFPEFRVAFQRAAEASGWTDPALAAAAEAIWAKLATPTQLGVMTRDLPYCDFVALNVVGALLDAGRIVPADI